MTATQKYRARMKTEGRCPMCGKDAEGKYMCRTCLDKEAIRKVGRKRHKSCIPRPKAFWKTVDWSLSDQELAEELKLTRSAISYQRRKKMKQS